MSGEVEMDDVRPAKYRRLDKETLHSRLDVEQFDLRPIYTWCETDEPGGTGPGWKLAELRSLDDIDDGSEWFDTPSQATDAMNSRTLAVPQSNAAGSGVPQRNDPQDQQEDHDYWASYDRTPGRTPSQKRSPAPASAAQATNRQRSHSELEYYARYCTEVQPAMDGHDPDEENPELGQSTLNGDPLPSTGRPISRPNGTSMFPSPTQNVHTSISAPRPISPTSSHGSIEKLEEKAAAMSEQQQQEVGPSSSVSVSSSGAQHAIKQHISTDVKSLFRLAKSAGMERREFERIVWTELECLSLLEGDE